MTEETKVETKQETEEEVEELKEIVEKLRPEISTNEEGVKKITFSEEGLKDLTPKGEAIVLENDLLGLRVQLFSRRVQVDNLISLGLGTLKSMMEITPIRIPLGVG